MSVVLSLTAVQVNAIPLNDDTVTPGFLGFGVFLALVAATVFLVRSMTSRMKKIQAPREADLMQEEWERAEAQRAGRPKAAGSKAAGSKSRPADSDDA
ncbi:hypothetical protein [Actinomadura sp. 7K507]|uniref:hypothetical protein n=1 Tax=Actinomadura sp. 7K507 TaxID=2530365 RepID=UPI001FB6B375|nr:hypothetical protein [Actinomadura sp. 7K507]